MKKVSLFILFVGILSSCKKEVSKNVDQDKIWTSFTLSYDENTDLTTATAQFRFSTENGTLLELSDPSSIMLEGTEMSWVSEEALYRSEFSGFVPMVEFTWVDLNGNMFTNTVEIHDIDFPVSIEGLHYSDSLTYFMWEGLPLDSFEKVILELDGSGNSFIQTLSVDSLGSTAIAIDSLTLSRIAVDTTTNIVGLVLRKRYDPPLQEATSKGGERVGVYRPTDRQTTLTD